MASPKIARLLLIAPQTAVLCDSNNFSTTGCQTGKSTPRSTPGVGGICVCSLDWYLMKVALIHSFYRSAFPSGENLAVQLQSSALLGAGHAVEIFGRHTDDFVGNPLYPIESAFTVATGRGPNPLEDVRAFRPDLVHVHNLFPNWGTRWLRHLDVPLVSTIHNFRPICAAGTLLRDGVFCELCPTQGSLNAVQNSCYRNSALKTLPLAIASRRSRIPTVFEHSDALIFLSERTRRIYQGYGLGFEEKSHVVPNFVDAPLNDDVRQRLGKEAHWVFAGRLSQEKGILDLIKDWPVGTPLLVVGGGPDEQACLEAARGKQITFFGQRDHEFVNLVLRNAKGLVFPSTCFENSPMIYLEALSHGLPVVALRGNAVADDVTDAQTGVAVSSMAGFQEGVQQVEKRYGFFRSNAISRFEYHFSKDVWLAKVEAVYRSLL